MSNSFVARWRSITSDPPANTGRYMVASNYGDCIATAFYTAESGDSGHPVGWTQLPRFNATHWLDWPQGQAAEFMR